jgi:cyclophilin family peptidyl-prolyl cis-trans isomerase
MALVAVALGGCSSGAKVWTHKYDDMAVKEEYQYYHHPETNTRVKNGWYNSYHPNGAYHEVGVYEENKRDGRWTAYFPNGTIMSEENYRDGEKVGTYVLYHEKGGIKEEGEYRDGKRQGQAVQYVENSSVAIELLDPTSPQMRRRAPDEFHAKFETSAGDFVVAVRRELSPNGVDRFYNLVHSGFYDEQRFFRVMPGFIVQWGLHGDPHVGAKWQEASIHDDPVASSNKRGTITYAQTNSPNSRTTQLFINLGDNSNHLDGQGFAAFGTISQGMTTVEAINSEYREKPNQQYIGERGNAYLRKAFPNLDYIKTAYIVE